MKFGKKIQMLRDYDGGRLSEGDVYTVGMGEPEDGKIIPGVADALIQEAADGNGPYAKRVDESDDTEDEE